MKLFPILNKTMLAAEQREAYGSWDARVWPSEASAERVDQREADIVGKCHRASFGRLMGWKVTNKVDIAAARRFRTGRLMELDIVTVAKEAGVFVASGVRIHVQDEETGLNLPLELDLVAIDPETKRLGIGENKTIYGWGAKKVIDGGEPKLEGLMQLLIYRNEFPTGAVLKRVILECYARKLELTNKIEQMKEEGAEPSEYKLLQRELDRNRVEVDLDRLMEASDEPVWTNMLYETRDDCTEREFEIEIFEEEDGTHYPTIDGVSAKIFSLESIYERYQTLQMYHLRARAEAQRLVAAQGYLEPGEDATYKDVATYRAKVLEEMRNLGPEFWPPAEYEFRYSPQKVEALFAAGLITKSAYGAYKSKGAKTHRDLGAWQCAFCNFKAKCISTEYPQYAHLVADIDEEGEEEAA